MSLSRERKQKRWQSSTSGSEDVNPMNYLSNLADAMLVLAVGIMVALVLHWNVKLLSDGDTENTIPVEEFSQEDFLGTENVPENASHAGEVYYDEETDTYYFVKRTEE